MKISTEKSKNIYKNALIVTGVFILAFALFSFIQIYIDSVDNAITEFEEQNNQVAEENDELYTQLIDSLNPADLFAFTALRTKIKVELHNNDLVVDQKYFTRLLMGSFSLNIEKKRLIMESLSDFEQKQIDNLIDIFEEEKHQFAEISKEEISKLQDLADKNIKEWLELDAEYNF